MKPLRIPPIVRRTNLHQGLLNRKGTILLPFLQERKLPKAQLHQSDA
jgi:hypothetical protein